MAFGSSEFQISASEDVRIVRVVRVALKQRYLPYCRIGYRF